MDLFIFGLLVAISDSILMFTIEPSIMDEMGRGTLVGVGVTGCLAMLVGLWVDLIKQLNSRSSSK